jgi:hypothetical protein
MYISAYQRIKKTLAFLSIFALIGTSVPLGAATAFAEEIAATVSEITAPEESEGSEQAEETGTTEEGEDSEETAPLDESADTAEDEGQDPETSGNASDEQVEGDAGTDEGVDTEEGAGEQEGETTETPKEEVAPQEPSSGPASSSDDAADTVVAASDLTLGADGIATVDTVVLGITYSAPQNSQVQVTFTSLPERAGSLSIEEVFLTDEQVAQLGALSNVAYDITSSMENGTFSYDLKLPVPESAAENTQVVFAETTEDLDAGSVTSVAVEQVAVEADERSVEITELDHFTIFVVTSFEEPQLTPPATSYNGIWTALGIGATVTQVPTGTEGITSSEGDNHAVIKTSAYTDWDGRKSEFPGGGYDTRVDVYLDMSLAAGHLFGNKRMAFSSAINDTSGDHRRDFVFHLGTRPLSAGKWVVSASNSLIDLPGNPFNDPITLTETGWYTLEHQFRDVGGVLEATLNIYKKGESSPVGSWELSHASDVIGDTVGGNRYGWFIDTGILNRFNKIAIDSAKIEYITSSDVPANLRYDNPAVACEGSTNLNYTQPKWDAVPDAVSYDYQALFNGSVVYSTNFTTNEHPGGTFGGGENGVWGFQVRSVYESGLTSDWSPVCEITLDTKKPVTEVLSPVSGGIYATSNLPTVHASSSDDRSGLVQVVANLYGPSGLIQSCVNQPLSPSVSSHNFSCDLSTLESQLATEGAYYLKINSKDAAGTVSNTVTWNFTVENTAPSVPTIIKPTPRQWFKVIPIQTQWTAATDAGSGIKEYEVAYSYDDEHTFGGSTCLDVAEIEGLPVSGCRTTSALSRGHTPGLPEQGGVTIWVRAFDNAGNASPWSSSVHYFYDATAPETTLVTPTGMVGNVFTVNGEASDNLSLNRVYVQLVHRATSQRYGGTTIHLSGTEQDWSREFNATTLGLPDGEYAAHVAVVDDAGNTASVGWSENFTLDTMAPAAPTGLAWTDSDSMNVPHNGTTALYAGAASWNQNSEADFDRYVYKYWNDIETSSYSDESTAWTLPRVGITNTSASGVFNQGEGVHHYCVVAVDTSGNESACSETFTITYDITDEGGGDEDLTPITMCKFIGESAQSGWGMTLSNTGEDATEYVTETDETGCVTISVDLADGPWTVVEENREGYTQETVESSEEDTVVPVGESDLEMCEFGIPSEEVGDSEYSCSFFNSQDEIDNDEQSSFSSGTRVGSRSSRPQARVLGASTSLDEGDFCTEPYITGVLGYEHDNDSAQVVRLQNFLNDHMTAGLAVTGVFETSTRQAVMDFQLRYASDILAPWGITNATGLVYHTTKKKINELVCEQEFPLTPEQANEISRTREEIAGVKVAGSDEPQGTVAGAETTFSTQQTVPKNVSSSSEDETVEEPADEEQGFFKRFWGSIFDN